MKIQVPQKLNEADLKELPEWGRLAVRSLNDTIEQLLNVASYLTFSDNFECEYVVGYFQHGVPQNVKLKRLRSAGGGIALGATGGVVTSMSVRGTSTPGQVQVTFWFAGAPSAVVKASCILLRDGLGGDSPSAAGSALAANPMLAATTAAGQSIPSGVMTTVKFGTVTVDTDGAYNVGTGVYTVPAGKGGDYSIQSSLAWNAAVGNFECLISIQVNGAELYRASTINPLGFQSMPISAILRLAAGDTVEVRAFNGSGGAQPLRTFAPSNFITIRRTP